MRSRGEAFSVYVYRAVEVAFQESVSEVHLKETNS